MSCMPETHLKVQRKTCEQTWCFVSFVPLTYNYQGLFWTHFPTLGCWYFISRLCFSSHGNATVLQLVLGWTSFTSFRWAITCSQGSVAILLSPWLQAKLWKEHGKSWSYFPAPKQRRASSTRSTPGKSNVVTKDVVCMQFEEGDIFAIPWGMRRAQLAELGLIGKVSLNNMWDKAAVASEISSIFRKAFHLEDNEEMPFQYLRCI